MRAFSALVLEIFLVTGCVISATYAQSSLRVSNDHYRYAIRSIEGRSVFVVEGYPRSTEASARALPTRFVDLPATSAQPPRLASVRLANAVSAWPLYRTISVRRPDGTIDDSLALVPGSPSVTEEVRVLHTTRMVTRQGPRWRVTVPLLAWTPSGVRWVEEYRFSEGAEIEHPASHPLPAAARAEGYPWMTHATGLDTSGTWYRPGEEVLVWHQRRDGLSVLTASALRDAGLDPTALQPALFQLVRKGRIQPMVGIGLEDNRFDEHDTLMYWGERNYQEDGYLTSPSSPLDPYPEYLHRSSDSAAYVLRLASGGGVWIRPESEIGGSAPALPWTYTTVHREEDQSLQVMSLIPDETQNPDWTRCDTWIWTVLQAPSTFRDILSISDPAPEGGPALLRVKLLGYYGKASVSPNHRVRVRFNGVLLDSITFSVSEQVLLSVPVPSSLLRAGLDTVSIENIDIQGGYSAVAVDWYDLVYPHRLSLTSSRWSATMEPSQSLGPRTLTMTGAERPQGWYLRAGSTGFRCLRLSSGDALPPHSWTIQDTLHLGDRLFVSASDSLLPVRHARVRRMPDLRSPHAGCDALVITHPRLNGSAMRYTDFLTRQYGVRTTILTVDDIYLAYSYGIFMPEALKLAVYDQWRNGSIRPASLLLAGEACVDTRATSGAWRENMVPTYGTPASDFWFVCFDSASIQPSLLVGRLAVSSDAEWTEYENRHRALISAPRAEWMKRVLLLSGGDPSENDTQMDRYRQVHRTMLASAVDPPPFGGLGTHFYKTAHPPSDFGPFSPDSVQAAFSAGALCISYVGHSAASTWGNGITDPARLRATTGALPFVSDFGCASAAFARAEGRSLGEAFVLGPSSHAIGYVGNSGFGYSSAATLLPPLFYEAMLRDGPLPMGEAHARMREEYVRLYGNLPAVRNSIHMTTLLGDPLLTPPVAAKVNLAVSPSGIGSKDAFITDGMDSLRFRVTFANTGRWVTDSVTLRVEDLVGGTTVTMRDVRRPIPAWETTLDVTLPSDRHPGPRLLRVQLDPEQRLDEETRADNTAEYQYSVLSTLFTAVNTSDALPFQLWRNVGVLHPMVSPGAVDQVLFLFDTTASFTAPLIHRVPYDTTVTWLDVLPSLHADTRYYWKARIEAPGQATVGPYRTWTGTRPAAFAQRGRDFAENDREELTSSDIGLQLPPPERALRILSAGYLDGNVGSIALDQTELLPRTSYQGFGVVVLDSVTGLPLDARVFDSALREEDADSLASFLNSISSGRRVVVAGAGDPSRNKNRFASAMQRIGAQLAEALSENASYLMMGIVGAGSEQTRELLLPRFSGEARLDTVIHARRDTGRVRSPLFGPAGRWTSVRWMASLPTGSRLRIRVWGRDSAGIETPMMESLSGDSLSLTSLDARVYPWIRLDAELVGSPQARPVLTRWEVDYAHPAELAMNYQSVRLQRDTAYVGEQPLLGIGVINAGEFPSLTSTLLLRLTDPMGGTRDLSPLAIPSLSTRQWFRREVDLPPLLMAGQWTVTTTIVPPAEMAEQVRSNNVYTTSFLVLRDTIRPTLEVTVDGQPPVDGDLVPTRPVLQLLLHDHSPLPLTDPTRFRLLLDDSLVLASDSRVEFQPASGSTSATLWFRPTLTAGDHRFQINASTMTGTPALDEDLRFTLRVETDPAIREVMNQPNPFDRVTVFTFLAAGAEAPTSARIKIYTLSGRCIRTLPFSGSLRIGLNASPEWDGRDEDGDRISNGLYLYKVIVDFPGRRVESIGKVVIAR